MNTSSPQADVQQPDTIRIKIVADSANEAVGAIQERFGGAAKVISVKQQEAGGLKRLLKKPRLEILVEAPRNIVKAETTPKASDDSEPKEPQAPAPVAENVDDGESQAAEEDAKAVEAQKTKSPIEKKYANAGSPGYFSELESEKEMNDAESAPLGTAANPVRRGTIEHVERAISMLKSVGFDDSLIERIRYELDFRSLGDLPTMEIYSRICDWLRKRFPKERSQLTGARRAFVGASGVGKTAAMCKAMSADVFVSGIEPIVLKVDGSVPNPSDGLEAFCEIVGAPFHRSIEEIEEADANRPIYVDIPGVDFSDGNALAECRDELDALGVDEVVVVANAAYETDLIAEAMAGGSRLGAQHVVFTHLDETRRAGKLWKYALNEGARPLFFSYGTNPAGDYTMDPFSYLLEKTFPQGRSLASAKPAKRKPSSGDEAKREEIANA